MGFGSNPFGPRRGPTGQITSVEQSGGDEVSRIFLELPQAVAAGPLKTLMREAEKIITAAEREEAPRESGLLRAAIGGTVVKSLGKTLFAATGVRWGFRRTVAPTARGGLKFLRRSRPEPGQAMNRDPARYVYPLSKGRKAVEAVTGKALHSQNDRFFTRAGEAPPNPFIEHALADAQGQVLGLLAPAGDEIEAIAGSLGKQ